MSLAYQLSVPSVFFFSIIIIERYIFLQYFSHQSLSFKIYPLICSIFLSIEYYALINISSSVLVIYIYIYIYILIFSQHSVSFPIGWLSVNDLGSNISVKSVPCSPLFRPLAYFSMFSYFLLFPRISHYRLFCHKS